MWYRSFLFPTRLATFAFWAVYYFWVISETLIVRLVRRHRQGAVNKGDRGSYWTVVLGIFASLGVAFAFRGAGIGLLPAWVEWPGLALILLGVALRSWAILVLGRFFSTRVELQAAHRVVVTGPYRYIRHPAYTGGLLTLAGVGLALGSWAAALLMAVILAFVYSYRVKVEEAFLLSSLREEYRAYMGRTGRLVPRRGGSGKAD